MRTGQGQDRSRGMRSHQGQREPTACSLMVPLCAPKVQLIPADPPQHAGQLLLQHQLPGGHNGSVSPFLLPPTPLPPHPHPPEDEEAGDAKHDEGEPGAQSHDGQCGEGGCHGLGFRLGGLLALLWGCAPPGKDGVGHSMHPLLSQEGSSTSKTQGGLSKGGAPFTQRMGRPSQRICFSAPE